MKVTSLTQSHSSRESDSFWGNFVKNAASNEKDGNIESVESEMHRWGEQSTLRRDANPVHAMEALKKNFPRIYLLFRKYCVLPATQNKDERVFSFVARNTQPLCRQIKVETIEKKVIVGSAIRNHGFIFNYLDGVDSSSDEEE
jgi:hypothetical protein